MSLLGPTYTPFTRCLAREAGHNGFEGWGCKGNVISRCGFFFVSCEISRLRGIAG